MVAHTYNPSTWDTEAGELLQVQSQPELIVRPYLKQTNKHLVIKTVWPQQASVTEAWTNGADYRAYRQAFLHMID